MKVKYMILALGMLPFAFLLTLISYFAAFAITVMTGGVNVLETDTAMVNQGVFNLIRFTMILVICGWMYYRSFIKSYYSSFDVKNKDDFKTHTVRIIKHFIKPLNLLSIIIIGLSLQLLTDAVLFILSSSFPAYFESYNAMIQEYTGSNSILFIATTILLGPPAEELIFRGLILGYARKALENSKNIKRAQMIAIIIQAVLFSIYHLNLIQMCYALICGIIFGIIAVKFESLIPTILIHMTVNGTLYLIPNKLFSEIPSSVGIALASLIFLGGSLVLLLIEHVDKSEATDEK